MRTSKEKRGGAGRAKEGVPKADLHDLIAVLLEHRPLSYPFERHIALATLCTWLYVVDDTELLQQAVITSAANVYINCNDPLRDEIPFLTKTTLARALADPPSSSDFLSWFVEIEHEIEAPADIVAFFMHCPRSEPASLNRALFFIEQNGFHFEDPTLEERRELRRKQRATSTLKSLWKYRAHLGPFIWAAQMALPEILMMPPDSPDMFKRASRMLKSPSNIARYFGVAKWCQEKLESRLEPTARGDISFFEFPRDMISIDPKIGTFNQEQLDILARYKAPQLRRPRKAPDIK